MSMVDVTVASNPCVQANTGAVSLSGSGSVITHLSADSVWSFPEQ